MQRFCLCWFGSFNGKSIKNTLSPILSFDCKWQTYVFLFRLKWHIQLKASHNFFFPFFVSWRWCCTWYKTNNFNKFYFIYESSKKSFPWLFIQDNRYFAQPFPQFTFIQLNRFGFMMANRHDAQRKCHDVWLF